MMKKTLLTLLATLSLTLCVQACASASTCRTADNDEAQDSHPTVTKDFRVSSFSQIDAGAAFDITFTQKSGRPTVSVRTTPRTLERVEVKVTGNTLYLSIKNRPSGWNRRNADHVDDVEVTLTSPQLEGIDLYGAAQLELTNDLKAHQLELDLSGASQMRAQDLLCDGGMELDLSGAAQLTCADISCTRMELDASGASKLNMAQLKANAVAADISGASHVSLGLTAQHLECNASGGSHLDLSRLHVPTVIIEASGASKAILNDVQTRTLRGLASGASYLEAQGLADRALYSATGGSKVQAGNLVAKDVEASCSSVGTIECHATDNLKTHTSGQGRIGYKGHPKMQIDNYSLYQID